METDKNQNDSNKKPIDDESKGETQIVEDENNDEKCKTNKFKFKNHARSFYYLYRTRQRSTGTIWGIAEGAMTGVYMAGKWGGAGGWIIGGLSELTGIIVCPIVGGICGGILGAMTDKYTVCQWAKDIRYSIGAGNGNGGIPVHGMLS